MPTIATQRSSRRITAARARVDQRRRCQVAAWNLDERNSAGDAAFARQVAGVRDARQRRECDRCRYEAAHHCSSTPGRRRSSSGFVVRSIARTDRALRQSRVDELSGTNVLRIRDHGAFRIRDDRVAAFERRERAHGVERSCRDGQALAELFYGLLRGSFDAGSRSVQAPCVRLRRAVRASAGAILTRGASRVRRRSPRSARTTRISRCSRSSRRCAR